MRAAAPPVGAALLALVTAGCDLRPAPTAPAHYVVGPPYRVDGIWRYPREQFDYADTGLAAVAEGHARVTADGEAFDPAALAAGHRTLQLPAIARVTNLETGRQVLVRINDRGPRQPGRLIELTPHAAELLGGTAPFQVRVETLEGESRAIARALAPESLPVSLAPRGAVESESLPPPPGARAAERVRTAPGGPAPPAAAPSVAMLVPLRLPEEVRQTAPRPGQLYVEAGRFARVQYATTMAARLAALGARVSTEYGGPADRPFRVRIGPLPTAAAADAALDRALRAGVSDARIVVDER